MADTLTPLPDWALRIVALAVFAALAGYVLFSWTPPAPGPDCAADQRPVVRDGEEVCLDAADVFLGRVTRASALEDDDEIRDVDTGERAVGHLDESCPAGSYDVYAGIGRVVVRNAGSDPVQVETGGDIYGIDPGERTTLPGDPTEERRVEICRSGDGAGSTRYRVDFQNVPTGDA